MFSKSRFNPGPGIADFWNEFRKPNPYRWPILAASAIPVLLMYLWVQSETYIIPPERPKVTYITSFAPDRSDVEIADSNRVNQQRKDELRKAQEAIAEQKKDMYRELGRATGLDVDAMEAKIAADRAREEARKAALQARGAADVRNGE